MKKLTGKLLKYLGIPVLILAAAFAVACLITKSKPRRFIDITSVHLGDWFYSTPAGTTEGNELVIFDGASAAHRDAFSLRTYGNLKVSASAEGDGLTFSAEGKGSELHERCTREIPSDWSAYKLLRLEFSGVTGGFCPRHKDRAKKKPIPVAFALRIRNDPGYVRTNWFGYGAYVSPRDKELEINLEHAPWFIDTKRVKQLCFALQDEPAGTGHLTLKRMVLRKAWSKKKGLGKARTTVHVAGESTKLLRYADLPPAPHLLKDGEIRLEGARNEVLAFQVVIRRGDSGPKSATVKLPPLKEADGQTLTPALYEERTIVVHEVSTYMYGAESLGAETYPDPLVPLKNPIELWDGNRMVWVDIHIPEQTPVGAYRSAVHVVIDGRENAFPLKLTVHPATLTHKDSNLAMVGYNPSLLQAYHDVEGAAYDALERQYHRLFHVHGAYLAAATSLDKLERFLPAIDGSMFRAGPGKGQPAPYWPVDIVARTKEDYQKGAVEAVRWFRSRKLPTQPFVYVAGDAGTRKAREKIRRVGKWIDGAPAPGNSLPVLVTEMFNHYDRTLPSIAGAADIYLTSKNFPEPANSRRKTTNEMYWVFNGIEPSDGSQALDRDGVSFRTWGWLSYLYKTQIWYYWNGMYFWDVLGMGPKTDPYEHAASYDQRVLGKGFQFGVGDGILAYPPYRDGEGPAASYRLKALRRGAQDRVYLLMAKACGRGKEAHAIARGLIPMAFGDAMGCNTTWPKDDGSWERARLKLLKILDECAAKPAAAGGPQ